MAKIDDYIYTNVREIKNEENATIKNERTSDLGASLQDYLFSGELPDAHIMQLKYEIIERDQLILKTKNSSKLAPLEQDPNMITRNIDTLKSECENLYQLVSLQVETLEQWNTYTVRPPLNVAFDLDDLRALNTHISDFLKALDDNIRDKQEEKERRKQERIKQLKLEKQKWLDAKRKRIEASINSEIEMDRLRLNNERISEFNNRRKQAEKSTKKCLSLSQEDEEFNARLQKFTRENNVKGYSMDVITAVIKNDEFLFNLTKKDPSSLETDECYKAISLCEEQKDLTKHLSFDMLYDLKVYGNYGNDLDRIISALKSAIENKKEGAYRSIFWLG